MTSKSELKTEYTLPTYAATWKAIRDRADFAAEQSMLADWEKRQIDLSKVPDGAVGVQIANYLRHQIWTHGQTTELAAANLKLGYERAQEVLKANVFEKVTTGPWQHPWGKKSFLEAKILLNALYEKKVLNKADAIELAAIEAQLAPHTAAAYWDSTAQGGYQFAIDLLLLTEAWPQAQSMVDNARGMRTMNVKQSFSTAKLILKNKGSMVDQPKAKLAYRQAFDMIRNPAADALPKGQHASVEFMFVMACIWQKFFEPGQGEYDYEKAIDLLWE